MTNTDAARSDIYQRVTDQIVAMIEAGAGKYEMPWHRAAGIPMNAISRKPYRGINTIMLWASAQVAGYPFDIWATFKQWKEIGANVRKGERATSIMFWKISDLKDKEDGDAEDAAGQEQHRSRAFAKGYAVFNAAQVDGYNPPVIPLLPAAERLAHAETFFAGLNADVRHGGTKACYVPSRDQIMMPEFEVFRSGVAYYSTLAHEVTHWTGHEKRCARDLRSRFGDEAYAAEEMVAELGAAFLAADLDLTPEPRPDHAGYIASWLKALKNDKRAIFTAAGKAQAAVDWMHACQANAGRMEDQAAA
jgi:antirestriction protein ArdC